MKKFKEPKFFFEKYIYRKYSKYLFWSAQTEISSTISDSFDKPKLKEQNNPKLWS